MLVLWIILAIIVICFGGVIAFGAPYLPTLKGQIGLALDLVELEPGQTLLELGSGDGRVLLAAARRGYHVVGYELNPLLVIISLVRTWRYRRLVTIHWRNFLTADWPPAEAIFIFGLDRIMPKVDAKIAKSASKPVRLVSFTFKIPGKKATRTASGLFVYDY